MHTNDMPSKKEQIDRDKLFWAQRRQHHGMTTTGWLALGAIFSKAAVMLHPETYERLMGRSANGTTVQTIYDALSPLYPNPRIMLGAAVAFMVSAGVSAYAAHKHASKQHRGPGMFQ